MKKTSFYLACGILMLVLAGFLESGNTLDNISTPGLGTSEEETRKVSVQPQEKSIPSSLEYILEGKKEVDGTIVETYREYEIYKDENGNIIKKIPTSNYDYLRYNNYDYPPKENY